MTMDESDGTKILKLPNLSVPELLPDDLAVMVANSIGWLVVESMTFPLMIFCALLISEIRSNMVNKSIFLIIDMIFVFHTVNF